VYSLKVAPAAASMPAVVTAETELATKIAAVLGLALLPVPVAVMPLLNTLVRPASVEGVVVPPSSSGSCGQPINANDILKRAIIPTKNVFFIKEVLLKKL
jgi:hypothetical protein